MANPETNRLKCRYLLINQNHTGCSKRRVTQRGSRMDSCHEETYPKAPRRQNGAWAASAHLSGPTEAGVGRSSETRDPCRGEAEGKALPRSLGGVCPALRLWNREHGRSASSPAALPGAEGGGWRGQQPGTLPTVCATGRRPQRSAGAPSPESTGDGAVGAGKRGAGTGAGGVRAGRTQAVPAAEPKRTAMAKVGPQGHHRVTTTLARPAECRGPNKPLTGNHHRSRHPGVINI